MIYLKMKKKFIIITITIILATFSNLTVASAGWVPIYESNILGIWRIVISPPHFGYAGPQVGDTRHQNYILYTTGLESVNIHLYKTSKNCFAAWESHSGAYVKYCDNNNPKKAVENVLHKIEQKFKDLSDYVDLIAVSAALGTFIKLCWDFIRDNWQIVYAL